MPKITITKKQAEALARGEDITLKAEKKKWPQNGNIVWFIGGGEVFYEEWGTKSWQTKTWLKKLRAQGMIYRTEKEAQKELDKLCAIQRVKDYIEDNFGVYEPDLENNKYMYSIRFHCEDNQCLWDRHYYTKIYSPYGYLRSEEDANQLIKDCKEDLLLIHK